MYHKGLLGLFRSGFAESMIPGAQHPRIVPLLSPFPVLMSLPLCFFSLQHAYIDGLVMVVVVVGQYG